MERGSRLLVVNFAMDTKSAIFAHQYETAQGLMGKFASVTVFTNRKGLCPAINGMNVVEVGWVEAEPIRNFLRLLSKLLPTLLRRDYDAVFYHMTDLQAAIFSPLVKVLGKHQVLWYAHAHPSLLLRWAEKWVDFIASSTKGSCTLSSQKVIIIGQAIKQENFPFLIFDSEVPFRKIVHFGRFDRGKRILELIEACQTLREEGYDLEFVQIGTASNFKDKLYELEVISTFSKLRWVTFLPPVERSQLSKILSGFSVFLHGFQGSLDKTLVESTFVGLPVATINEEYLEIFGQWSSSHPTNLVAELRTILEIETSDLDLEIRRRRLIAVSDHSFEKWIDKLSVLLMQPNKARGRL